MKQRDVEANFATFRRMVKSRIDSDLSDYDLEEIQAHLHLPEMWVIFRNGTTEVQVSFEYTGGVFVALGKLWRRPKMFSVVSYGLDELLMLRAPQRAQHTRMEDFDEHAVEQVLRERCEALKQFADDVLRGTFDLFPHLAALRAARTR